jgi:catechol 2,3-dioxygenase-like lactoylglutathione lyase family enzyme
VCPVRGYGRGMLSDSQFYAGIAVDDIDAAYAFYADTLGLDVERRDNPWLLSLRGPGDRAVLIYARPGPHTPPAYTVLNFPVADIEAEVDALTAAGVVFERYADGPVATNEKGIAHPGPWQAWFRDPAGNILSVVQ